MASAAEMEKLQSTLDYFRRYHEFEEAIAVNQENRQYLNTYIHNKGHVEEEFGLDKKNKLATLIGLGAGAVVGLIAMLIAGLSDFGVKNIIAFVVAFVIVFIAVMMVIKQRFFKQFQAKWEEQKDVNIGLGNQMDDLARRCDALEKQKGDYLKALEEKGLVCIPVNHINCSDEIAEYVKSGKVETVEEAVKLFEENITLKKMAEEKKKKEAMLKRQKQAEAARATKTQSAPVKRTAPSSLSIGAGTSAKPVAKTEAPASSKTEKAPNTMGLSISASSAPASKPASKPATTPVASTKKLSEVAKADTSENEQQAQIGMELQRLLGASSTSTSAPKRRQSTGLSFADFAAKKEEKAQEAAPAPEYEEIRLVDEPEMEETIAFAQKIIADTPKAEVAPIVEDVAEETVAPIAEEVAVVEEAVAPISSEPAPFTVRATPVEEKAEPVVATAEPIAEKPALSFPAFNTQPSEEAASDSPVKITIENEQGEAVGETEKPVAKSFGGLSMTGFTRSTPVIEEKAEEPAPQPAQSTGFLRMAGK